MIEWAERHPVGLEVGDRRMVPGANERPIGGRQPRAGDGQDEAGARRTKPDDRDPGAHPVGCDVAPGCDVPVGPVSVEPVSVAPVSAGRCSASAPAGGSTRAP